MFRRIAGQKECLGVTPSVAAIDISKINSLKLLLHQLAKLAGFFMKWSKPGGECRRNAPQAVMVHADIDDSEHIAYWPGVDPSDWCGEWEAKQ